MRRILIVANTYYQLIMAMQMKFTLFSEDYVTLLLSDHSNNAESVHEHLKKQQLFDECVFVKSKGVIHNRSKMDKMKEFFQIVFSKSNQYEFYLKELSSLYYDEIIFYNLEIDTYGVFSILAEHNKKLQYSSYEEGVLSYGNFFYDSTKFKIVRKLRRIIGKPAIFDRYQKFYCVYPELYKGFLEAVQIPQISTENKRLKEVLADIFQIQSGVDYSQFRYIYFESIYDTEGRGIGEVELLLEFAKRVGKENILVKKHPRSTNYVYEENGIAVDTNSAAPFEAIQLNHDMSGCTFVAAMSGSVLSVNSIVDQPSNVLLIYPLTDYQKRQDTYEFAMHVEDVINQFQSAGKMGHLKILRSTNEFFEQKH